MKESSGVSAPKIKKLDNSGVTLIELIVVAAIMGVVVGAMVLSSGFVGRSRVTSAYKLLQSDYSLARTNSMTKAVSTDFKIILRDNTYYLQVGVDTEEKLIAASTEITFRVSEDGYEYSDISFSEMASKCGSADTVTFSFEKASGALKPYATNSYISAIYIGNKGLFITYETGKYSTTDYE